ncbi:MAG: GntR family transcriptional regulator [Hyphomicrobiales bacterium]|nr:GntR family transcriptional regulator [Hyphomicrobiales bacterium]
MSNDLGRGKSSLTDRIHDLLRDQIVSFELKPFHAISDKKLAEKIGVSRTPVREALARLAARGLVDIYPQRGTVVSPLRRIDLERSQFVREALEVGLVQRVAALDGRFELTRKLRAEVALQETFAELGDDHRFYTSDEDFHRLIATYAGLPGIWEDIGPSKIHMDRCRHLTLATVEKDVRIITDQHNAIIDAIERGDPDTAAEAMRAHLRRVLQFVDQLMEIHPEYFEGTGAATLAVKLESAAAATN